MGECGPAGPDDPEQVHVQDAVPLLVVVVGHGALGADAGVVDQHVEPAELAHDLLDRRADRGVVGDVGAHAEHAVGHAGGVEVECGHGGAALAQDPDDRRADARGAAGDGRDQAVQVTAGGAHEATSAVAPAYAVTSWRCRPRPSISTSTTSPGAR